MRIFQTHHEERGDVQLDDVPGYIYLPEPSGRTKQVTDGGDTGGGGLPSSEGDWRRTPKAKKKTNVRRRKGRGSDSCSSDFGTDTKSPEDDKHHNCKKQKKKQSESDEACSK